MIAMRTKPSSLLATVFLRMGATMLLAIAAVSALLFYEFADHIDNMRDRSLNGQASDIIRHIEVAADGAVVVDLPPSLNAAYNEAIENPPRFVVLDRSGNVIAASPGLDRPLYSGEPAAPDEWYFFKLNDPLHGQAVYGASVTPARYGSRLTVQVSQSSEHHDVLADTLLDELMDEYLWVVLFVFATILAVTYATLRSTLAPLTEISQQAAAIGPSTLDRRLDPTPLPVEVRPLVEAVNNALERVEHGFSVQRRFTADAAHEMRTPIALLRTHLGNLDTEQAAALRADLDNLERVVGQLLKLAQVESRVPDPERRAELGQVCRHVAAYLAPKALADGRSITLDADNRVTIKGDPESLEVAVRNLVENALRFTPEGLEVSIEVTASPPAVVVLDRGPGIAPEDRANLFSQFWRKDRSTSAGAGLGLSIVSRIAANHDAELVVEDRPGGGAVFRLVFPATVDNSPADPRKVSPA